MKYIIPFILLSGCAAIVGIEPKTDTRTAVKGAYEIVPGYVNKIAYDSSAACIVRYSGKINYVPSYQDIHWYIYPDTVFFLNGAGPYVGYSNGLAITIAFKQPWYSYQKLLEHEVAHILTQEVGHSSDFWIKCNWYKPYVLTFTPSDIY